MELYQLRSFVAVAETGNFTRAAEQAHITQPALSQQILNLEEEFGHKLFHRLGRKAVLTETGNVLLARARRILFEVADATRELSDSTSLERRITIGAVQTVMPYLFAPFIAGMRETHPNLTVHTREGFRHDLVQAVINGDLDLAVVPMPVEDPRISVEPLLTEPLLLAVAKNHPFATRSEINISDLADENFISLGDLSTLHTQIRSFFGDNNFVPRIAYRCAQVATLKIFVSLQLGISLLPELARTADDRDTLTYLRLTGSAPTRELAVIRHLQRYQSRGAEQFLTLLRQHVQERMAAVPAAES